VTGAAADASARRAAFIRDALVPYFRQHLRKQGLRSALLLVAQYWADEADDAVHYEIIWSKLDEPDVAAGLAALDHEDGEGRDRTNLDGRPQGIGLVANYSAKNPAQWGLIEGWDENLGAIPLFAQYCLEDCHQEMLVSEAYAPCLRFRLIDDQVEYELVGENRRPWLEGVVPTWAQEHEGDGEPGGAPSGDDDRSELPRAHLQSSRTVSPAARIGLAAALAVAIALLIRACAG